MNHRHPIFYLVLFLLSALVVTAFFHQPPQLVDVFSRQPVLDMEIRTSPGRILFEPFIGPLVFYLSANHPLIEFSMLFIWILCGLFILTLFKYRKTAISGVLVWLALVPLWIMIMLGIVAVSVFVPLPGDTLVNHNPDLVLVNFHSHSYFSHDGIMSPQRVARWHRAHGFDAFFLTEHNNHNKTLEWVAAQDQGTFPASPLILCGQEYSGSTHLLLLGLNRDVNTKDMADSTAVQTAHGQNGAVLVAHWFETKPRPLQYYVQCGVDGFEIVNQNQGIDYEKSVFEQIAGICRSHKLVAIGACDYHGYGNVCSVWNALSIPGWRGMTPERQRSSITELVKQRDQSRLAVVLYQDRRSVKSVLWSPPLTAVDYFLSLSISQRLAWFFWTAFLWLLIKKWPGGTILSAGRLTAQAALVCGLWLMLWGGYFFYQSHTVSGDNKIFSEYSLWFLGVGSAGALYSFLRREKKS